MTACVCVQQDVVVQQDAVGRQGTVGQQDVGWGGGGAAQQRSAQLGGKHQNEADTPAGVEGASDDSDSAGHNPAAVGVQLPGFGMLVNITWLAAKAASRPGVAPRTCCLLAISTTSPNTTFEANMPPPSGSDSAMPTAAPPSCMMIGTRSGHNHHTSPTQHSGDIVQSVGRLLCAALGCVHYPAVAHGCLMCRRERRSWMRQCV